ncbi:MAG: MerR family DNA-binding transcriptional regulator [Anaerolineae bacterium]|nr:MerR family DNA-binding transcriptional regulator [Anaerolineae bacterium]
MSIRPIDIARKLGLSTTSLRVYEEMGLVPPVSRTPHGYRRYTNEHIAYFICFRRMIPAFDTTFIKNVLQDVQKGQIDCAYWRITRAQARLWNERQTAQKFSERISQKSEPSFTFGKKLMNIKEISQKTDIPVTTIRHWEKAGLISPHRDKNNGYRLYDDKHIQQLLTLFVIKLSVRDNRQKHFIGKIKEAYAGFEYEDGAKIQKFMDDINQRLDTMNRLQIEALLALQHLCQQVQSGLFNDGLD